MKKGFLLFLVVFMAIQFNVLADNPVRINIPGLNLPKLLITEVRPDGETTAYVELTNIGDTPIDLATSENEYFVLESVFYNTRLVAVSDSVIEFNRANSILEEQVGKVYLKGIIQPGESFVVASVWDTDDARGSGIPRHNTAIAQIGNQFVYKDESTFTNGWINKPEWQTFGKDSVYSGEPTIELLRAESSAGYLIRWFYQAEDLTFTSTYIDQFNFFHHPEVNGSEKGREIFSIAGVEDAMTTSVMVRKAIVNKGNLNWDQSRGTDATTSEWLVIPKNSSRRDAFTTVGVHGVYNLDYTLNDPATITVDEGAKTISVPWELTRGDSLSHYFDLGKGMSWAYKLNGVSADTASYIARDDDMFSFYAVGNVLDRVDYTLEVREPEADVAMVFPKRRLNFGEEIVTDEITGLVDTVATRSWSGFLFPVVEGPVIDTIINVPFATRTDSLLLYLDKPAKATFDIVFVDGKNRIDLMLGDILKVTSENRATVKEYFIKVNEHEVGQNALLSSVTWPDIDKMLYPRWNVGDTLPEFDPLKTEYFVELRSDAKKIPAFQFKTQDLKARTEVKSAVSINGNLEQRTTSVKVYAESDTTTLTYNFRFVKQRAPVQPNNAEPFISELLKNINTQGYAVEIYNPGTEELDLSQYMYVRGNSGQTWQQAVATLIATNNAGAYASGNQLKIYKTHYSPSKRWAADGSLEAWSATPTEENPFIGQGFLKDDNQTDPWVDGQDVWIAGIGMGTGDTHVKIRQESDFLFRGNEAEGNMYAWDSTLILHRETPVWTYNNTFLLKILNDSIIYGTKVVTDPADYELIDRFDAIGDSVGGENLSGNLSIVRKPSVSKGNVDPFGGGTETAESSEWIVRKGHLVDNLGIHVMDPITNFVSTVTSLKLIVTPGYRGADLTITGNIADYTPTTIALVLDKGDMSQTFEFKRGEVVLTAEQSLIDGDVLTVTSGDGRAQTMYTLVNQPLNSSTSLTAKAGSGLTVSGTKVGGVTFGMTLTHVVANLEVANTSILNVLDASGALQPLVMHDLEGMIKSVMVSKNVKLQVVAENGDMAIYSFDFGFDSSIAILGSNILEINQDKRQVMELPINSTVPSFLSMVFANEGATVRVLDRAGFERTVGFMNVDDQIEVTAADGVAKAIYGLSEEGYYNSVKGSVESAIKVVLYPMPVTNVLNIQGLELAAVQVYSLSGSMIISQTSSSNTVDVSGLPKGVYIIKMKDVNGKVAVEKFLKK